MPKINFKIVLIFVAIIAVVGGAALYYFLVLGQPTISYNYAEVTKGSITDSANADGEVKAAEEVQLAFERAAKVAAVNVKVGDQVKTGQVLASLVSADLNAQLIQAQAAVKSAQAGLLGAQAQYGAQAANLSNLKNGPRPEDLAVSQAQVDTAQKAVNDAQLNLNNVNTKALNDLSNLYGKTSDVLNDAYAKTFDAVNSKIADLFSDAATANPSLNFQTSDSGLELNVKTERSDANNDLAAMRQEIDALNGDEANTDNVLSDIDLRLNNVRNFLNDLNLLMNYTITSTSFTQANLDAAKANISLGLAAVNAAIASVQGQTQAIASQKVTNQNAVTSAQTLENTANNNLALALKQLALKKAGSTADQIQAQSEAVNQAAAGVAAQSAAVSSAQANVLNIGSQLAKSSLTSPLDGTVTQADAQAGEIAAPNVPVFSVISNAKFQVETYFSENDIAKIKLGQTANVTLDAYGSDKIFPAKVIAIDPAETVINGAPTYKVTLEFLNEDSLIKDGLTANVEIVIAVKNDALLIPASSVIKNNDSFVLVAGANNTVAQIKVITGITQNGEVEIISGLTAGERVVDFGK